MGFGVAGPQIAAGTVKPLVAVGDKRSAFMPELPSLGDVGADPGLSGYFGLFAPHDTPKLIIDRLNAEFGKVMSAPKVMEFYKNSTLVRSRTRPSNSQRSLSADGEAAAKVFKSIGVTPQAVPQ